MTSPTKKYTYKMRTIRWDLFFLFLKSQKITLNWVLISFVCHLQTIEVCGPVIYLSKNGINKHQHEAAVCVNVCVCLQIKDHPILNGCHSHRPESFSQGVWSTTRIQTQLKRAQISSPARGSQQAFSRKQKVTSNRQNNNLASPATVMFILSWHISWNSDIGNNAEIKCANCIQAVSTVITLNVLSP